MLAALTLAALLTSDPGTPAPSRAELRRELDGVAARIAALKARAMEGEDVRAALQPLLVRAQDVAEALDRASPDPAAPRSPSAPAEDLRAHADALFEEADALAGELAELEARISAALDAGAYPAAEPAGPGALPVSVGAVQGEVPARCAGGGAAAPPPAIAPLLVQRARLKARVGQLLTEAAALDDAADRLER